MKDTKTAPAADSPQVPLSAHSAAGGSCLHGVEYFTLAWLAGMLSAFLASFIPFLAVLPVLLWMFRNRRMEFRIMMPALLLGGAVWMLFDVTVRRPLLALDGQTVTCTGTVTDCRRLASDRICYTLLTRLSGRSTVTEWYADSEMPLLKTCDTVTLRAELQCYRSSVLANTAQTQTAKGRFLRIARAELLTFQQDDSFSLRRAVQDYRADITGIIQAEMPPDEAGLLCAMLFGDKSGLSDELYDAIYSAGIGHVAAVSGLHLVFFCGGILLLLRLLHVPARLQFFLLIPAIGVFILLVDSSVSVYRAAVMVLLTRSAGLFGRRSSPLRSLCLAALGCTAAAPYIIGSASFWLSVSGVLGIAVIAPYLTADIRSKPVRTFCALCCVSLTVFPASVLLCGDASLYGPVCNLLILPVCMAALYLGFLLLLSGGLLKCVLIPAEILCLTVKLFTERTAKLPLSHIALHSPVLRADLMICTVILAYMLLCRMKPKHFVRAAAVFAAMLAAISAAIHLTAASQLRVTVIGSGKKAVAVIETDGETVLADLGAAPCNAQDAARYLSYCGTTEVVAVFAASDRSAAAYREALGAVRTEHYIIPQTDALREGSALGETAVLQLSPENFVCTCGEANVSRSGDSLTVHWNGMTVLLLTDDTPADTDAAAIIRFRKNDGFAIQTANGTEQGSCLQLRLTKDNKYLITPLV